MASIMTNNFNAIEQLENLIQAGIPDKQAKAQVKALQLVKEDIESNLATKKDLEHVKAELETKMEYAKAELKKDIKNLDEKIGNAQSGFRKDVALIMGSYSALILGVLVTLAQLGLLTPVKP